MTPAAPGTTRKRWALLGLLRGPGGLVRIAGLVCLVVALTLRGPVDVGLFGLVLAGLLVPVLGAVRPGLDAAYGVGLLVAAWCGALDLYETVVWLDVAMHLVVTGLVAAVGHLVVARRTGALADPAGAASTAARVGSVAMTASLGLALSVAWEVSEYLGNTYVDPAIFVDYPDTIGDLVMGGLGSTVAGIALLRGRRRAG